MRISASWFGSIRSTEYKDVARDLTITGPIEAGSASCRVIPVLLLYPPPRPPRGVSKEREGGVARLFLT